MEGFCSSRLIGEYRDAVRNIPQDKHKHTLYTDSRTNTYKHQYTQDTEEMVLWWYSLKYSHKHDPAISDSEGHTYYTVCFEYTVRRTQCNVFTVGV